MKSVFSTKTTPDKKGVLVFPGVEPRELTNNEVRIALVFQLPFRLQTAKCIGCETELDEAISHIYLYNNLSFPEGADIAKVLKEYHGNYKQLWSLVVVIVKGKFIDEKEIDILRQGKELQKRLTTNVQESVLNPPFDFRPFVPNCVTTINQLIFASTWIATKRKGISGLFGVTQIRSLTESDISCLLRSQVALLCPESYELDEAGIEMIISAGLEDYSVEYIETIREDSFDIPNVSTDDAYSAPFRPPIPEQIGHPFRLIPATNSGAFRPL